MACAGPGLAGPRPPRSKLEYVQTGYSRAHITLAGNVVFDEECYGKAMRKKEPSLKCYEKAMEIRFFFQLNIV